MFERLTARAGQAGKERARRRAEALAERLETELPSGVAAEASESGVRLSGKGIAARFALEPELRWLLARMR